MLKILNYKHLFFFLLIILQMVAYNYPYLLSIEPRNFHAWRQYDCLSFAQGFFNDRSDFLVPRLNNLGLNDGRALSDFPLIQMLVGYIWKFTGVNSGIYRFVNLLFLLFGLFYIYKLFLERFKHKIFAALIAAFFFTSPNLSYYGISPLSDIQSFALSMAGLYYFYSWLKNKQTKHLSIFIAFFILAGLLKVSAAMVYSLCILYLILECIQLKSLKFTLPEHIKPKQLFAFAIPCVCWFAWFMYVSDYNTKNHSNFFLVGLNPIWKLQYTQVIRYTTALVFNLLPTVIHPALMFGIIIFTLTNTVFNIKKYLSASVTLLFCLLLFIVYLLLFFGAMDVHDYYLLNNLGLVVIAVFFIFEICSMELFSVNSTKVIFTIALLVVMNTYTSSLKTWMKTNCNVVHTENALLFNSGEQSVIFMNYLLDRQRFKALEDQKGDFSAAGMLMTDTIFCMGDETITRSLYLMNRVGYTNYNASVKDTPGFLRKHPGVKYLVLLDSTLRRHDYLQKIFAHKVFEKTSLSVYRIN